MFVIVGLGNIGDEYVDTRHNAGRRTLTAWVAARGASFVPSKKFHAQIAELSLGSVSVLALLPETYMNQSGGVVAKAVPTQSDAAQLVVLYDDIDLPLGTVRVSFDRGSGGHNGIKSVATSLKTERFVRIRIGISPKVGGVMRKPKGEEKVLAFVMGAFKKVEQKTFDEVCVRVGEIIETIVSEGREVAMNRFNGA